MEQESVRRRGRRKGPGGQSLQKGPCVRGAGAASAGGSAGSLCPASLVLLAGPSPSLRTPGPASTTTGCLVLLGRGWGALEGGPLFPRELCVHLRGQSLTGQEGESLGLFLMGTEDPGVDRELLVMKGVPSPGSEPPSEVGLGKKGAWAGLPGGSRPQLYGAQLTTRGHCLPGRAPDPGFRRADGPRCALSAYGVGGGGVGVR